MMASKAETSARGAAPPPEKKLRKIGPAPAAVAATTALLIEPVLAKISKNLPVQDLLRLRQTCTDWNHNFIPEIKLCHREIRFEITDGQNTQSKYSSFRELKDYANCMRLSKEIPFGKYRISNPTVDSSSWLEFLTVCGPSVKSLALEFPPDDSGQINAGVVIQDLLELVPQLEVLELWEMLVLFGRVSVPPIWGAGKRSQIKVKLPKLKKLVVADAVVAQELLNELIRCAVNLKCLQVMPYTIHNLSVAVALQNYSSNLSKLRNLYLWCWSPHHLNILADLRNLRLTQFGLTIRHAEGYNDDYTEFAELTKFLTVQAPTLQNLKLYLHYSMQIREPIIKIPTLDNVHSLGLTDQWNYWTSEPNKIKYEGGTLASAFPTLKSFTWTSGYNVREIHQNTHDGVTHLNLPQEGAEKCLGMNFGFPALTHLEINMNSAKGEHFAQLWGKWPNLTSLHIEIESFWKVDELLTGVPADAHEYLKTEVGFWGNGTPRDFGLDKIRQVLKKYKTRPGISALTQLRKLTLESTYYWNRLTDFSGYFGLAMASSTLLHISILPHRKVSTDDYDDDFDRSPHRISPHCEGLIREALGPHVFLDL